MSGTANTMMNRTRDAAAATLRIAGYLVAFARGLLYIARFRIFRRNITIGFPLFAFAPVCIEGPGTVRIGKGCCAFNNVFRGLTIVTLSPDATVEIGDRCSLGGTTIRSRRYVKVGDRIMTAICLVQDSFFVDREGVSSRRHIGPACEANPVAIGNNVWLGAHSIVLGGCRIGDDAVIGAGSCCHNVEVGAYTLVSGNMARKPLPIEKLLRLKGIA